MKKRYVVLLVMCVVIILGASFVLLNKSVVKQKEVSVERFANIQSGDFVRYLGSWCQVTRTNQGTIIFKYNSVLVPFTAHNMTNDVPVPDEFAGNLGIDSVVYRATNHIVWDSLVLHYNSHD